MPPPTGDRRSAVDFDPAYFARRAAQGDRFGPEAAFRHAYEANLWTGPESRSGPGSSLDQTAALRAALPALLAGLGVHSLLDLPCGDCHWIAQVELPGIAYVGGDLLPELILRNRARFGPARRFELLDLTTSLLPPADLLLCRDCLVHLSFADLAQALENIRRSGVTWLLTTTFPAQDTNEEITTGDWRPLNLERAPVHFPPPALLLNEECTEQDGLFRDKSLGLWRVTDLLESAP